MLWICSCALYLLSALATLAFNLKLFSEQDFFLLLFVLLLFFAAPEKFKGSRC